VVGDRTRLCQVITNLVGNAIKFTQVGEVVLVVARETLEADRLQLHFTVRDTGIGIPRDKLKTIFDPFSQADGSTTRKYGGTGLGLTISMRLVQAMQGNLWVESEPGKGSCFHFTASFGSAAGEEQPQHGGPIELQGPAPSLTANDPARENRGPALQILLTEDNIVNQRVALRILEKAGHSVVIAGNGREALHALERQPFDLVLMDVQMPEMDGLEAAALIRQNEKGTGRHVPIIAMTAHAMTGDQERCLAAGMDAYIAKPIRSGDLVKLVEEQSSVANSESR
jgi:CheY-like chemotaxis protein